MNLTIFETGGLYQKLIATNEMTDYHLNFSLHGFVMIFFDEILRLLQEKGHFLFVRSGDLFLMQKCFEVLYVTGIKEEISIYAKFLAMQFSYSLILPYFI